jgi:hypothetical protein
MSHGMRILWMGCFAFTAVVFLLQVLPVTGVILMFLAAPYWSVLTINLAFALMLLDAAAGDLPKHLIVFPVLWFVGYIVATGISHLKAYELAAEIISENSTASLPFDPQQDQLIIEPDNLRHDKIISDEGLIQTYALNKIYRRFDGNPNCPSVQMVSLRSYSCGSGSSLEKDANGCPTIVNAITISNGSYYNFKILKGVCLVYAPVRALSLTSRVTVKRTAVRTLRGWTLEGNIQSFEVQRSSEQKIVRVKAGFILPLAWVPLPLLGCAGGGSEEWSCRFQFIRNDVIFVGSEQNRGAQGAIARVLQLAPAPLSNRFPEPPG